MVLRRQVAGDVYETFKPGGRLHPTYFLEHKGHLVIEAVCLLVIAYLSLHPRAPHRSRKQEAPLSEQARLGARLCALEAGGRSEICSMAWSACMAALERPAPVRCRV